MDTIRGNTLIGAVDGTVHGNPDLVSGKTGKALRLNGNQSDRQWVDLGSHG